LRAYSRHLNIKSFETDKRHFVAASHWDRIYLTNDAVFCESELQKLAEKSVYVLEDVYLAVVEWATARHIRYCCALIEAEWQLLSMEEQGIIDGILTISF
jgi:hypothetical protein